MVFSCVLCEAETVILHSFCPSCRIIKNIGNCYGFTEIKEVLERVCIRNETQRTNKINIELKKNNEKKIYGEPK